METVMILMAHADDEALGCGGYIPILVNRGCNVSLIIASNCLVTARGKMQNNKDAVSKSCKILGIQNVFYLDLEDQHFEKYLVSDIVNRIEAFEINPNLIISHVSSDLNLDHRIIHDCAKIVGRSINRQIKILGCEVPNTSAWNARPFNANFYVDITATIQKKVDAFSCYKNELREFPHPWSSKGLLITAQQRGMEAGLEYAEAYEVIRWFG